MNATILVDMDGVLCWWEKHLIKRMNELYPDFPMFEFGTRTEESAHVINGLYETPEMQSVLAEDGFYYALEPIDGAKEALLEMEKLGYDVAICTAPSIRNKTCASDKYNWVIKHYGESWANRVIVTRDKTRVHGDILIDDKSQVRGAQHPSWTHVVFDQSYNRADLNRPRMNGWADWRRAVEEALAARV